ncbi:MAG: family 43 glycosylhydrolase, partial [Prevotella sp.]|nr:family 43 glycosylhydrolase [Prevotella sp.]
ACGIGNIQICELDEDFNYIQEKNVISGKDGLEGCHFYKIGDYYYIYATYGGWPSGQAVFRSKNVFGPYEEKMLVEKIINGKPNTVHQGALFDTPNGEWWTIMQEDLGALGRMPNLQPVKWQDGWPVVAANGVPYATYNKPAVGASYPRTGMPTNDNFRSYPIRPQWEWNHNPNNGAWSLFERPGWLRLKTSDKANVLTQARNMLTQRIFAFEDRVSAGTVRIDVSQLGEGDRAGICILQDPYGMIAAEKKNGQYRLVWQEGGLKDGEPAGKRAVQAMDELQDGIIYLRATVNYKTSKTQFYYSTDNQTYYKLGKETTLGFNLSIFVGARFGIFCYATQDGSEGFADFDWFSTEVNYDESMFYPEHFEGFSEDMLTAVSLKLDGVASEVMVGNSGQLQVEAVYRDGHTDNVAAQCRFETDASDVIEIKNGQIRGLGEGVATVNVTYTDPMGNELTGAFTVRSTFFPFGAQYINTSLFAQGTYNETTRTFKPGQWGQMGWEYPNGANMSGYKYLVIKLKQAQTCGAHLNIFTSGNIWGECHSTPDFGSKKQIVVNLKTAKYTSDNKKGQALDTSNIHIVDFWGNGQGIIVVEDMYLTNNDDYSPMSTAVKDVIVMHDEPLSVYTLSGQLVRRSATPQQATQGLARGIYIIGGKKIVVE